MLKNKKGLSLTTMVITVMIMFIIMGALVYSAVDSVKVRKLNKLYDDLRTLGDSVEVYYLKNGELPVDTEKGQMALSSSSTEEDISKIGFVLKNGVTTISNEESFFNPNDYDSSEGEATYSFIKLSLLENLSLNYSDNDYIINNQSHTIYNYTGLTVDGKVYHSLPLTYKYTMYNEKHPVKTIRVASKTGITNGSNIYFSDNIETINLRDYLIFDNNSNDGLGEPKTVVFSTISSDYCSLSEEGILRITNSKNFPESNTTSLSTTVTATSYGTGSPDRTLVLTLKPSAIKINKNGKEDVYLAKNKVNSTCIFSKNTTDLEVKKYGSATTSMSVFVDDGNIVSGTYTDNGDGTGTLTLTSGSKAGKSDVTLQDKSNGLASDIIQSVNVYDFKIYEGQAGSNTDITKLNLTGIGATSSTNLMLNVDRENSIDLKLESISNSIIWSTDNEEIISISNSNGGLVATVTPLKVGTANLSCVVNVEGEKFVEFKIPVTVSGIVNEDDSVIKDDTISLTGSNKTVRVKYSFGDSNITSYTFETPKSSLNSFTVKNVENNIFEITYTGTAEARSTITIVANVRKRKI